MWLRKDFTYFTTIWVPFSPWTPSPVGGFGGGLRQLWQCTSADQHLGSLGDGMAPPYSCDGLQRVAELNRRQLRSSTSNALVVPATRLVTVGDRAFPVAGSRLLNSLPTDVTSATTLPVFCSRLKTYLFSVSFPAWFVLFNLHSPSVFAVYINLRHLKNISNVM